MNANLCDICIARDGKISRGHWRYGYRGDRVKLDVCLKHKGTKLSQKEILEIAIDAESKLGALLERLSEGTG